MLKTRFLAGALLFMAALAHADPFEALITLDSSLGPRQGGRLLLFVHRLARGADPEDEVDLNVFSADSGFVAAKEVTAIQSGRFVMVDGEKDFYPAAFSTLPAGKYEMQAVLDRDHKYAYEGRGAGDLISKVETFEWPGPLPTLALSSVVPEEDEAAVLADMPAERREAIETFAPQLKEINFRSKLMSDFPRAPYNLRESTFIRGWVALPPGYDGKKVFPTVYSFPGFGSTLPSVKRSAAVMMAMMAHGHAPPMIWVYLDYSVPTGTHEFADSVSNGPWGAALTTEFIPWLEKKYRMDAAPSGRFVTGHSSGGWAALWLQVTYPKLFGGSWPVSPDPTDFRNLFGSDIYAPDANFYFDAQGKPWPGSRPNEDGFVVTIEALARSEAVFGEYGGQFATYDFIYGPRGESNRLQRLYDHDTGKIDPEVAKYWGEHYDIGRILTRNWATLKPDLDGKIHLIVGGEDTWYLDKAAETLVETMKSIGAKTDFRVIEGKGHNDVYMRDGDRLALLKDIANEMYRQARPPN